MIEKCQIPLQKPSFHPVTPGANHINSRQTVAGAEDEMTDRQADGIKVFIKPPCTLLEF